MDEKITSPVKAIRAKCLDCCGDSATEVKLCVSKNCVLYPFRFGKNPYVKRNYTDEQRAAMAERLAKIKEKKDMEE